MWIFQYKFSNGWYDGKQVNLVETSEMLKAEPIIENVWIVEQFSKYAKEKEWYFSEWNFRKKLGKLL